MTQAFVNAPLQRARPPSAGVSTDDGEETLGWREAGSARRRAGRRLSPTSLQSETDPTRRRKMEKQNSYRHCLRVSHSWSSPPTADDCYIKFKLPSSLQSLRCPGCEQTAQGLPTQKGGSPDLHPGLLDPQTQVFNQLTCPL